MSFNQFLFDGSVSSKLLVWAVSSKFVSWQLSNDNLCIIANKRKGKRQFQSPHIFSCVTDSFTNQYQLSFTNFSTHLDKTNQWSKRRLSNGVSYTYFTRRSSRDFEGSDVNVELHFAEHQHVQQAFVMQSPAINILSAVHVNSNVSIVVIFVQVEGVGLSAV